MLNSIQKYQILIFIFFLHACSKKEKSSKLIVQTDNQDSIFIEYDLYEKIIDTTCYFQNDLAKQKCDSVLMNVFGEEIFNQNINWIQNKSFINCDVNGIVKLLEFGDSSCCNPRTFDLIYSIKIKERTIYQFRMSAGKDMHFEPISEIVNGQLIAYKNLINGKFKIDIHRAEQIANKMVYKGQDKTIELFYDNKGEQNSFNSFYWEVDSNTNHKFKDVLIINPNSGKVEKHSVIISNITSAKK